MAGNARFWDRIAAKYAARPVADEAAYQEKLRRTRVHLTPGMQLVEIGCGTGSTALVHAPHVAHVLAADLSPAMLEIARGKAAAAGIGNISFEVAAIEDLDVAPGSVDMVLTLSLLHLLHDPAGAIRRVQGMLKPGGLFVSSTACLGDMTPALRIVLPLARALGQAPFVKVFTAEALRGMIRDAGFEIIDDYRPAPKAAVFLIARKPA
jgi:ubiquinone/menaquinone biosynthesis C-methylase UbiE